MSKNEDTVSKILWNELDEDDYFSNRVIGAIGLMKIIIGKLTIALEQSRLNEAKDIHSDTKENMPTNTNADCLQMDELQIEYMSECAKYYYEENSSKRKKKLTTKDAYYGHELKLTELTDAVEERAQRKIRMQSAFLKMLKPKRTVTGG